MKEATRQKKREELKPYQEVVEKFRDDLGQRVSDDATLEVIDRLLSLEKIEQGICDHCGGIAKVRYPDYKAVLQALRLVLEYYIGKPVQRIEETKEIKGRVELVALKEAPTEELRAIIAESRRLEPGS